MKEVSLYAMAILYIAAGVMHFIKPGMYFKIMPAFLPWPLLLVYISGACELLLGGLLLPPATRVMAAWGIILLLVAVFPANIQMMVLYYQKHLPYRWLTVARLPLQFLLIWWAWTFTKR
ncbi:MAG TPA: hypothetical protein VL307_04435 [Chitinophagaceae bacterium]|nr:hypothetical protein [Chitinophagaceae bacterium]